MWKLICWNLSFKNAGSSDISAWSDSNHTLLDVKDGVEVPEERLAEHPVVFLVILEWKEAFVAVANVENVGLR